MTGPQSRKLPGPWRITFDTNPDICNLRCIMCEEHSIYADKEGAKKGARKSGKRLMEFDIIRMVIESAAPHGLKEIIPSTMGEPLLYEHFDKIVDIVREYDLKLNLTTNGTFPGRGAEGWGEFVLPVASDVKVSISGATKETAEFIMKGIDTEKQMEDLRRFIRIRDEVRKNGMNHPTVTFQVTYMEKNLPELPDLLKLAISMGADRFKGHHLWITWPELENESLRRNAESIRRWNRTVEELYEITEKFRLPNGSKIKLDNVYKLSEKSSEKSEIVPVHWLCPFVGRESWIAWDGTFNVCCSPDNLRRSLGYFGNVKEDDFMELWNGTEYERFVRNWGSYDVCRKCNMRKPPEELKRCVYGNI
ncbi:MAG: SPASM domain-containing protein [Thermoplasmata archaeon]|nr:SPASM domain-containing protein [Thermoplasmata archaeon]